MPIQTTDLTYNQNTTLDSPYEVEENITVEIAENVVVEIVLTGVALEDPEIRIMV
jgi:hypothetical protein